jgi:endo-1,4-beta-mannosidase
MGGQVMRIYTLSIPDNELDKTRHIRILSGYGTSNVTWELNTDLMVDFDRMLNLARENNVKIIVPFIDKWDWWGGYFAFAKMYGKSKKEFWEDASLFEEWKRLLAQIITRKNSVTGIEYSADPSIFGWETGNELFFNDTTVNSNWTIKTADYIKKLDSNHLVIDGTYGKFGWDPAVLNHPSIDVYSNHFYQESKLFVGLTVLDITVASIGLLIALFSVFFVFKVFVSDSISKRLQVLKSPQFNIIRKYGNLLITMFALTFGTVSLFFIIRQRSIMETTALGARLKNDMDIVNRAGKAYLLGEVGLFPIDDIRNVLTAFLASNCPGILFWSLRSHSRDGGFCNY